MADPEYDWAISSLNSLISGKQRIDSGNWHHAFDMMRVYLEVGSAVARWVTRTDDHADMSACLIYACRAQRLDLTDKLPRLSVIHVAGTKGKVS